MLIKPQALKQISPLIVRPKTKCIILSHLNSYKLFGGSGYAQAKAQSLISKKVAFFLTKSFQDREGTSRPSGLARQQSGGMKKI